MNVDNFKNTDPFAEEQGLDIDDKVVGSQEDIHIRIQQRNGRKTLTTMQGIPKGENRRKLLKKFKKEFACNGTIVEDDDLGEIIQLQGDHRQKLSNFLKDSGVKQAVIKIHGF